MLAQGTTGPTGPRPCPEAPIAYEGEDQVVRELRAQRQDVVEECRALRDALADAQVELTALRDGHDELIAGLVDGTYRVDLTDGTEERPLWVRSTGPTGATGAQRVALVEDQADVIELGIADLRTDLWFGLGMAAAGLFGYGLYRVVMPRA